MGSESEVKRQNNRIRKAKRRKELRVLLIVALLIILLIFGIVTIFNYLSGAPSKEARTPADIGGIPVIESLIPTETPGRIGQTMNIKHIVIHETGNAGNNANAAAHNSYIQKQAAAVALSWHYTVDDHEIYKHLPDNEVGFHAGDRYTENGGNMNGIGIEMCINPENDYEKTLLNTASLVKYLMKEYKLDIADVKKHQDFSGKICPERLILNNRWDEFIKMVQNAE